MNRIDSVKGTNYHVQLLPNMKSLDQGCANFFAVGSIMLYQVITLASSFFHVLCWRSTSNGSSFKNKIKNCFS